MGERADREACATSLTPSPNVSKFFLSISWEPRRRLGAVVESLGFIGGRVQIGKQHPCHLKIAAPQAHSRGAIRLDQRPIRYEPTPLRCCTAHLGVALPCLESRRQKEHRMDCLAVDE